MERNFKHEESALMESVWEYSVKGQALPRKPLEGDIRTKALVIGAGMAGILTAWRLKQAGIECVVAEASGVGSKTTKNTTAKITAQHGFIYADLNRRLGPSRARLYYESNARAIEDYKELAAHYDCDFEAKTAYVYTTDDRRALEREANAYGRLGLPDHIVKDLPLPIKTAGALAMRNQAQFNPMKLLTALAGELNIFENTPVLDVEGKRAIAKNGRIFADHIILATHFPLINIPGLYFMKLYQHRSYVAALEGAPLVDGMFVDEKETGYSFRTYGDLLLIGGGDHRTGEKGGGLGVLRQLEARAYPGAREKFRWATQDCMSLDKVPYIGRHRSGTKTLYVATGFNKWGMTGSMVASRLICDLITTGKSELEQLYNPDRPMLFPKLAANAASSAAGLLSPVDPRCSHMGCRLHKNEAEGSWDCHCHGSRFDKEGRVIDNPAKRSIKL